MKRGENEQKRVEEIPGEESADDGMKQEIEIWTLQLQSGCCRYSPDPTAAVRNQLEKRRCGRRALGPAKVSISQLGICMCYFWLGVPAVQTRDSPCANCRDRLSKGFIFLSSSPRPTGDGWHSKGPRLAVSSTSQPLWFHTSSLFSCTGALCWPPMGARRWQHPPGVLCAQVAVRCQRRAGGLPKAPARSPPAAGFENREIATLPLSTPQAGLLPSPFPGTTHHGKHFPCCAQLGKLPQ